MPALGGVNSTTSVQTLLADPVDEWEAETAYAEGDRIKFGADDGDRVFRTPSVGTSGEEIPDFGATLPQQPTVADGGVDNWYFIGFVGQPSFVDLAETVTALAPAGGGFDYAQAADPGAVGEGKLWLQTPPVPAPLTWTSGFEYTYADHGPVQPTVPNDHVYLPTGPFVGTQEAGVSEPTWPTDGSTVVDNEITWQDEGLIEEFFDALVEEPFRTLWRRNVADDGWDPVGYGPAFGGDTAFDLSQYYATGVLASQIGVEFGSLSFATKDKRGRTRGALSLGTTDLELAIYDAGGAYLYSIKFNANDGGINIIGLPSVDPDVAGALFTDGAPTAGTPQALMVSGGPA